jgi:L-lactate dehydrogenase complex protein LldE
MSSPGTGSSTTGKDIRPRVGLFVTCLANIYRPNVGLAAVALLERAGCSVEVPLAQSCCGQPSYNNGDLDGAARTARQTIEAFEACDYVVAPSGSCGGMLRDYPRLFASDPGWQQRARAMAAKTHELISFLTDIRGLTEVDAAFPHRVTYHDSCHGLRALGIREQPRRLLATVRGLELRELADSEICCGFGGTFCVKYPEISGRLVGDKAAAIQATDAEVVLGGDLGCLLNIAGRLGREGGRVRVYHVAEVLAGMADIPGLGDAREQKGGS